MINISLALPSTANRYSSKEQSWGRAQSGHYMTKHQNLAQIEKIISVSNKAAIMTLEERAFVEEESATSGFDWNLCRFLFFLMNTLVDKSKFTNIRP